MSITHLNPLSAVVAKQEAEIERLRAACEIIVSAFDALKPTIKARYETLHINAARAALTTKGTV